MANVSANGTLVGAEMSQEMAAFVSVLAVAVIGVGLVLWPVVWRNVSRLSRARALREFTEAYWVPLAVLAGMLVTNVILSVSTGVNWPELHNSVMVPYSGVSGFVFGVAMSIWALRGRKGGGGGGSGVRRSIPGVFFLLSLGYLVSTVVSAAVGASMIAAYALDVMALTAHPESISNFASGKVLVYDSVQLFVAGLITFGLAYMIEMLEDEEREKGAGGEVTGTET